MPTLSCESSTRSPSPSFTFPILHLTRPSPSSSLLWTALTRSNASGRTTLAADLVFLDHLATLPSLKRYFPSYFAINYSPSELADNTSDIIKNKLAVNDRARALNIPFTLIGNGLFEPFLTFAAFTGIDIANATVSLYGDAADRKLQITSLPYLASAVGELALKDPAALQPSYTVFEYAASGNEIAKAIEQATGRKVEIKQVTDAEIEGGRKAGDPAALSSTVKVKWGTGEFQAEDAYNPAGERKTIALAIKEAVDAAK